MQSIEDVRTTIRMTQSVHTSLAAPQSTIVYGYAGSESHGCYWLCLDRTCPVDDLGSDAPVFGSALTIDRACEWAERHLAWHAINRQSDRAILRIDVTAVAGRAIRHALGLGY